MLAVLRFRGLQPNAPKPVVAGGQVEDGSRRLQGGHVWELEGRRVYALVRAHSLCTVPRLRRGYQDQAEEANVVPN